MAPTARVPGPDPLLSASWSPPLQAGHLSRHCVRNTPAWDPHTTSISQGPRVPSSLGRKGKQLLGLGCFSRQCGVWTITQGSGGSGGRDPCFPALKLPGLGPPPGSVSAVHVTPQDEGSEAIPNQHTTGGAATVLGTSSRSGPQELAGQRGDSYGRSTGCGGA